MIYGPLVGWSTTVDWLALHALVLNRQICRKALASLNSRRSSPTLALLQANAEADGGIISNDELLASVLPLSVFGDDADAARRATGLDDEEGFTRGALIPEFTGPGKQSLNLALHSAPEGPFCARSQKSALVVSVHAKLAELALSGKQPLQDDVPDVASAGFHLVCAAAANELRALRDMRRCCCSLP